MIASLPIYHERKELSTLALHMTGKKEKRKCKKEKKKKKEKNVHSYMHNHSPMELQKRRHGLQFQKKLPLTKEVINCA